MSRRDDDPLQDLPFAPSLHPQPRTTRSSPPQYQVQDGPFPPPHAPEDWTKPGRSISEEGVSRLRPRHSPSPPSPNPHHHSRLHHHHHRSRRPSPDPPQPVCREPSTVKVCVDLHSGSCYKPPRPPKAAAGPLLSTPEAPEVLPWRANPFVENENPPTAARMRIKGDRDKMTMRSEAMRYWRSIHNKYSLLNGFNRQRRSALVKKHRQRVKERNHLSIFFVLVFMLVFVTILVAEVFFIDEHRSGMLFSSKRTNEFDSLGDIPDYFMDDKKLVGQLEIDTYRRQELSVKAKAGNEERFFRKNVDETHLMARVTGNLVQSVQGLAKADWLASLGLTHVTYFGANSTATDGEWQPIYHTRHKFFVYSAFYDDRKGRIIRVVGATQTKKSDRVWCKYWYSNSSTLIVNGAIKIIRENWNLKFSACFIACPLTIYRNGKQPIPPPESVSLMADPGGNATNKLRVLNLDVAKEEVRDTFAVCVKPLHFDYNNVNQMIEFVELNRILGVEHFTLYNHTVGPGVDCVLRHYAAEGVATVLPWKLDIKSQKEIRTEGLFAALNDCLYRLMYRHRYVLMIDLDEYIVPHANATLPQLLRYLHTKADASKVGAVSFQNSFFYLQWPDDPNSASLPPLVTLRKTRRRQRFHPHKQRSKYIAVTPYVVEAGNHFVWEFLAGRGTLNVPNEVAFLHHYRVCEFGGDDCVRNPRITDTSMYRYKEQLITAFTSTLRRLASTCPLEAAAKDKTVWTLG